MKGPIYMLDTNIASYLIKGASPAIRTHLSHVSMSQICISSITEAELRFGLAKRGHPEVLKAALQNLFMYVEIMPWDSNAAEQYAFLRNALEQTGKSLGSMDLLIAAHAIALGATLITNDQAFTHAASFLKVADWTK